MTVEGEVVFYDRDGGYGFIETDSIDDVFYHISDVSNRVPEHALRFGTEVVCDVEQTDDGPRARSVEVVE